MIKNIKLSLLTLAFGLVVALPLTASAALNTFAATINGGATTSVAIGATVDLTATTDITGTSSWNGSRYVFAQSMPTQGSMICADTGDVAGPNPTALVSGTVSTPAIPGVYNLYVSAQEDGGCTTPGNIFELPGALTVLANAQTITFDTISPLTKTYGDAAVTVYATSSSNLAVTFSTTASANVCTVTSGGLVTFTGAGSCDVTANQAGDITYAPAAPVTQTFTISPASVTLDTTGAIATKVYDATTTVSFSGTPITVNGLISPDVVTVAGTYASKNVGSQTVTLSLAGADASKYTLTGGNTMTGDITAKTLTIGATAPAKTYDGTTNTSVTYSDDRVLSDDITVSGTAAFTDKHTGVSKNIDITNISLTGTDAGNYTYSTVASTSATITARSLTLAAVTDARVYNGTSSSTQPVTVSLQTGDTYTAYQEFDNKNVGTLKTITPFITIVDGNSGNNYVISTTTTTGDITAKDVSVADLTIESKVYDKTTGATKSASTTPTLTGVVAGDESNVTLDFSGASFTYDNENVGTGKTVTSAGIVLTGSEAVNYNLTATTVTGDITARPISVTATTLATKVYDATNASAGTPVISAGTLAGADAASFTQSYDDENVGTGKTVNVSGSVTDGNSGNNYAVTFVPRTDGVITVATLNVTALGSTKIYDNTTDASTTVTLFDNRISTSTETFTISFASATYSDEFVGNGKLITVSGLTKSGVGANNYVFGATTITTTGDITAKTLTVTANVPGKVYDTTTNATVSYTDDRLAGDVLGVTGTAAFNDKTAGVAKLVVLSPVALFGPDSANYVVSAQTSTTADITPASTTVSFTADNKVYDATSTAVVLTSSVAGAIGGDVVTVSGGTANFNDKNVGNGKTVSASGFVLGGVDGNNYVVVTVNPTTADITAYDVTVMVTALDKVYDATTTASTSASVTGLVGDDLSVATTTGNFSDKNVGNGKTVTVNGLVLTGTDAGNYNLTSTTETTTANITSQSVTASITATSRVYDATASSTAVCSVNGSAGDDLTCTASSALFEDAEVGTAKLVTATGITLGGTDAGNYVLTSTDATTTADIYPYVPVGGSQSYGGGGGVSYGGSSTPTNPSTPSVGTPISSIATSTAACEPVFTKYMRYGRANDKAEVVKLQAFLNKYMGAKLPLTGFFGTLTRASVMKFQSVHLKMAKPTGLVLMNTVIMMNAMECANK